MGYAKVGSDHDITITGSYIGGGTSPGTGLGIGTPTPGNLLIIVVFNATGAAVPQTLTYSQGGSSQALVTSSVVQTGTILAASGSRSGQQVSIYALIVPSALGTGGAATITGFLNIGNSGWTHSEEWSGNPSTIAACFDVGNGTPTLSSTSSTLPTLTPAGANELCVAAVQPSASIGTGTTPSWSGTPGLTLGTFAVSGAPPNFTGAAVYTGTTVTSVVGTWTSGGGTPTARACANAIALFKPQASVNLAGSATAQISHSESSVQNATTGIAASVSSNQLATAQILPGSSATKTKLISATANVSNSVTGPLQPAASSISNTVTAQINAIAMIDPPLWSPLILMGSGNSFDQVLGSQYFELSANIDGGSSANDQTYFLDGGRSV